MIHDFYFSINNREEVIKLPIPPKFRFSSPFNNQKAESISQGTINLIGLRGLKETSLEGFFPSKPNKYNFQRDNLYTGWEYVQKIEEWRRKRVPIRLIITDTPMNIPVLIDNFEYGEQDGTGDIYYTMQISEFKLVEIAGV